MPLSMQSRLAPHQKKVGFEHHAQERHGDPALRGQRGMVEAVEQPGQAGEVAADPFQQPLQRRLVEQ
jgi:hypothetical protein